MRLADSAQMREMDRYTIEEIGVPSLVLMENAARSFVAAIEDLLDISAHVYVFCGPGNNGGDGYAIARQLKNRGYKLTVVAVVPAKSQDCRKMASIYSHYGETLEWDTFLARAMNLTRDDLLIDAVLGTGIETMIKEPLKSRLIEIDQFPGHKCAVDLPSGIDGATGDLLGAGIKVDRTITFQAEQPGHHLYPGKEYRGQLIRQDISIMERYAGDGPDIQLIDFAEANRLMPKRPAESYKNKMGHLTTWCGSSNTLGASLMASMAALKCGSGLVTQALPKSSQNLFVEQVPELMNYAQEDIEADWLGGFDALVLGCGLGRNQAQWRKIEEILIETKLPLVVDADAFYGNLDWEKLDPKRLVLTPHPGEFKQLSGFDSPKDNREKIEQGFEWVKENHAILVLKGAPSLVFADNQKLFINSTGNPGMATAGSGDVLSGIIGSFLGRGLTPLDAAVLGLWVHGRCGDLAFEKLGADNMTATSLIDQLGSVLKELG